MRQLSPANTQTNMLEKKTLYFAAGSAECWLCHQQGQLNFFQPQQTLKQSLLLPNFPQHIAL